MTKMKILIGLIAVCMFFVSQSDRADAITFDFVKAIDDCGYDGTITMFGGNGDPGKRNSIGKPYRREEVRHWYGYKLAILG